ncbi:Spo0E family sporulation regulatory protein-aspartic acid phosphatase [Brevibacillus sp. H7]|jgi:hypothetical protein|uniref:Spo0E family sporulation regulatory protein-aspartic acid phosphatase n=1 Tax=Brevibacillus sp. H7 TaxID=3349138 RepID=UPI0038208354
MEITRKMIDELRQQLERAAKEVGYNFLDPEIVAISQQLDKLIVAHMLQLSKRP